jgi:hypothetical protein
MDAALSWVSGNQTHLIGVRVVIEQTSFSAAPLFVTEYL